MMNGGLRGASPPLAHLFSLLPEQNPVDDWLVHLVTFMVLCLNEVNEFHEVNPDIRFSAAKQISGVLSVTHRKARSFC